MSLYSSFTFYGKISGVFVSSKRFIGLIKDFRDQGLKKQNKLISPFNKKKKKMVINCVAYILLSLTIPKYYVITR